MDREHSRIELLSVQLAGCGVLALTLLALSASGNAAQTASLSVTQPSLAAAMPTSAPEATPASLDRLESLGMGDMVRVTVFRNPDLTTEARVSERGTILFPMIGEVPRDPV